MEDGGRSESVVRNDVLLAAETAVIMIEISIRHSDEKRESLQNSKFLASIIRKRQ
jgi:hypothetical protein